MSLNRSETTSNTNNNSNNEVATVDFKIKSSELTFTTEIGQGAYCTVYKGLLNKQEVAVKRLKRPTKEYKKTAKKEISILEELSQKPNSTHFIVKFLGYTDSLSIAMELMPKGSLENVIQKNSKAPFNWSLRIKIMLNIAQGLKFLHDNNIIHRDLKAANILVNNNDEVKLADFGLSTHFNNKEKCKLIGTPTLTAPEILALLYLDDHSNLVSTKPFKYTFEAEIYAFGLLLWCLASWKTEPYKGFNSAEQFKQFIVNKKEREPIAAECPKKIADLIQWCWKQEPEGRANEQQIINELSNKDILPEISVKP